MVVAGWLAQQGAGHEVGEIDTPAHFGVEPVVIGGIIGIAGAGPVVAGIPDWWQHASITTRLVAGGALPGTRGNILQHGLDVGKTQRRWHIGQAVVNHDAQGNRRTGGPPLAGHQLHRIGSILRGSKSRRCGAGVGKGCATAGVAGERPLEAAGVKAHGCGQGGRPLLDHAVRPRVCNWAARREAAIAVGTRKRQAGCSAGGTRQVGQQVVRHGLEQAHRTAEFVIDQLGQWHIAAVDDMRLDPVLIGVEMVKGFEVDIRLLAGTAQQVADAAGLGLYFVQSRLADSAPARLHIAVHRRRGCAGHTVKAVVGKPIAAVHGLQMRGSGTLVLKGRGHAPARVFRPRQGRAGGWERERAQDHLVDGLHRGLLVCPRVTRNGGEVKRGRLERMQARLHIAPVLGVRVHDQREQLLAGPRVGRRQGVAAPAVAADAHRGHGLGRPAIQADGAQAGAGYRVKGIELGKTAIRRPPARSRQGARAELDRVRAKMPLGHLFNSRLQVQGRIAAVGTHQVVFHHEGHAAVRVLVRRHAPPVAQVTLVTHGDVAFAMPAVGAADVVGELPFRQRIFCVARVDGLVIGLCVFRRADLEYPVGAHDRVRVQQKPVEPGGYRRPARGVDHHIAAAARTTAATAACGQQHGQPHEACRSPDSWPTPRVAHRHFPKTASSRQPTTGSPCNCVPRSRRLAASRVLTGHTATRSRASRAAPRPRCNPG